LIANGQGEFALAPAFDLLPSGQALGFQQMRVGDQGADSTIKNALSACRQFGLTQTEASEEVKTVATVVNVWQKHFIDKGIAGQDLALLSAQIDRPFLKQQRLAWV
jgi:serine/threonine-protein kinase HipA